MELLEKLAALFEHTEALNEKTQKFPDCAHEALVKSGPYLGHDEIADWWGEWGNENCDEAEE
ncbi:MAG: hypothetical protein IT440_15690 [Phycisphaeraceae bacterium]|nr:hypothetical protein [Phycisphaeraceae bacterium]